MSSPIIIGIGGACSSSGKTTIASALIKELTNKCINDEKSSQAPSLSMSMISTKKRWGAIKYTKTEFYSSIIDDPDILNEPDKDTCRFIDAGAQEVLWIQSPPENLHEVIPLALDRLYHLDGIIIEGNSAIEFVKPDVIVFVSCRDGLEIKPSGWKILQNAQIIIISEDSQLINHLDCHQYCRVISTRVFQENISEDIIKEAIAYMDILINKKDTVKLLLERSVNREISCSDARRIAEQRGLPYREIGRLADDLNIKIRNCELGCF